MKNTFLLFLLFITNCAFAQQNITPLHLPEQIRKNFSYDSLALLACSNTPPGFYMVHFTVNKKGQLYFSKAPNDTLQALKELFRAAIEKSVAGGNTVKLKKGNYLQPVFFNNTTYCNPYRNKQNQLQQVPLDSAVAFNSNPDKEIISILSRQLTAIEQSARAISTYSGKMTVLQTAIINNVNPADENGHLKL